MEKKFEIGDRVRIVADELPGHKLTLEKGYTGVIVGVAHNRYVRVEFDGHVMGDAFVDGKDLELAEPYDPKTAFLSELKELLEKYNVNLIAHKTDMPISAYFVGEEMPFVNIGKEVNRGCGVVVTADTIMNYDKE